MKFINYDSSLPLGFSFIIDFGRMFSIVFLI